MTEPETGPSKEPQGDNPLHPGRALVGLGVLLLVLSIAAGFAGIVVDRADKRHTLAIWLGVGAIVGGFVGSFLAYKKPYQNITLTAGFGAVIVGVAALVIGFVR